MSDNASRRTFLAAAGAGAAALATGAGAASADVKKTAPAQRAIPRWRGFNLLDFFQAFNRNYQSQGMISEDDCRWMRDWGFDFIRLPMDYWIWIDTDWRRTRKLSPDDVYKIKESALAKVDRTVELGRKYGLHVSLNFHRAPGYCVNNPGREPFSLWKDKLAQDAFVHHWDVFAKRYKGIDSKHLSFNLINESPRPKKDGMSREEYVRVMTRATGQIRKTSPDRLIIIDGLAYGNLTVDEMIPAKVAQSVHAYTPAQISHYRASWVDRKSSFPEPTWPLRKKDGAVWHSRETLEKHYAPWAALARKGIGVHCGEAGCFSRTPHAVFMAWFTDVMEILKGYGIGWSLWNLRGPFGLVDSGRKDVKYEDFHNHKLDRKLLDLLRKH